MDLTAKQLKWVLRHFPELKSATDYTNCLHTVPCYISNNKEFRARFLSLKSIPEELAFNWAYFVGDDDLMFKHIKSDKWHYRWASDIDVSLYMRIIERKDKKIDKQQKEIKRLVQVVHRLEHESGKFDTMDHFTKGNKNKGYTG